MVKLPVGPVEQVWTARLGKVEAGEWSSDGAEALATPRVVCSVSELGGYDLSWIVIERFSGSPMMAGGSGEDVRSLLETTAAFQAHATASHALSTPRSCPDYRALLSASRERVHLGGIEDESRWIEVLDRVDGELGGLVHEWEHRAMNAWCHGDVHGGNAMWRKCRDGRRHCVLLDLAMVHPGHWLEDGLYFERQQWGHEEQLDGVDPVRCLSGIRERLGLEVGPWKALVRVRRVLLAMAVPGLLGREGDGAYVQRALEILERRGGWDPIPHTER